MVEKRREWSRLHVVEQCGAQGGGAVLGLKFFRRNSLREGKKEGNRIARNSLLYMRALIHTKKY